jgi:hypothetical protein
MAERATAPAAPPAAPSAAPPAPRCAPWLDRRQRLSLPRSGQPVEYANLPDGMWIERSNRARAGGAERDGA